ncbi:MAG: cytidine deaminase [Bacteroidales bacterium]|nr:cytidine deaminase [Bacteroidales bacterium]MDD4209197.1 cytidine deaminase [Bacteroidales bacterium]
MENKTIEIQYTHYLSIEELPLEYKQLIQEARKAKLQAYAPYSRFRVGAAVLLSDNSIIRANNQENISYPEGLCAERVALFYASANYPDKTIKAIAIAGANVGKLTDSSITPCGGCRQVMAEYENKQKETIKVLMTAASGEIILVDGIDKLLPFQFKM